MALTINTNIQSMIAQKNLRRTESPLSQAMQRLSSGKRINSARDDAAGLAISTRQTRQIRGLSVAMRNANDGISFAQTAEGAMNEMINSLQRINELSVQAASHNTTADRESLDKEVQELVNELKRVVSQTRFNGETFLNRSQSVDIQVGNEVQEIINVSSANVSPNTMGIATSYAETLGASHIAVSTFQSYMSAGLGDAATINTIDIGAAIATADYQNNSKALIDRINSFTDETGVTAFGFGNSLVAGTAPIAIDAAAAAPFSVGQGYLSVNGVQLASFSTSNDASGAVAALASAINAQRFEMGVTAHLVDATTGSYTAAADATANSVLVLSNTNGAAISVTVNSGVSGGNYFASHGFASLNMSVDAGQNGKIIFNDDFEKSTVTFDASTTGAVFGVTETELNSAAGGGAATASLTATSVDNISITTAANANVAILAAQSALDVLTAEEANIGAKLNRLESTIRSIEDTIENVSAARSRIVDADFAKETATMTKQLILQQAGTSILAQANQLPNNALLLLQ